MPTDSRIEVTDSERSESRNRVAIVYDFDGTLGKGNMQAHSLIPSMGIKPKKFWRKVKALAKQNDADEILAYMCLMIKKAPKDAPITKKQLLDHGGNVPLFKGLEGEGRSWFDRLKTYADELQLDIDHYIISSGLEEMIEGSPISKRFRHVFASKFIYEGGRAKWPGVAVNYTTKTQYLFRINKGVENHWNNALINAYTPGHARPIPFQRMIFVGDGETDIPAMKMVTYMGGHSIAVYDRSALKKNPDEARERIETIRGLISDDRVDFVAPADYRENSHLDIIVKGILGRIQRRCEAP